MGHIKRFDHVGVTVRDLERATDFFVGLGLEVEGRTFVEGDFIDDVIAIPGSRTEIVMLRCPGGGSMVELSSFVHPDMTDGSPDAMANELGIRNLGFEVDDIEATVAWAEEQGYGLVGAIGQYAGIWRMAYIRGPEGIIASVAERIG
jgi:catechol 2,3-dioxygenase-like lactoylglutathione lyase family enzyme